MQNSSCLKFLVISIKIALIFGSYSQQIQDHILSDYGNINQPGEKITVNFDLQLFGVTQVDTIQGVISISCYFNLRWIDPRINWDPLNFGNQSYITLRTDLDLIWVPDVFMYENAEQPFNQLVEEKIAFRINYDGKIDWSRPGVIMIKHQFDLKGYPFDIQTIHMTFSSWFADTNRIEFKTNENPHAILSGHYFSNNVEWNFLSLTWSDVRETWPAGSFDMVNIQIKIQRNGGIVMNFLIIPAIFCGLILMNFYFIPIDSTDRLNFLLTMILSIVLLILVMFDKLPMNNQNMLAKQMFDIIVFSSFALFFWVALIGAIYKLKASKYKIVKRKLLEINKKQGPKIYTKQDFYHEIKEKFDIVIKSLCKYEVNKFVQAKPKTELQIFQEVQTQYEKEKNINTNQFLQETVSFQQQEITQSPQTVNNIDSIKYLFNIKKVSELSWQTQKIVYKKIFKILKIIDLGMVVIAFAIFLGLNINIVIQFSDYW